MAATKKTPAAPAPEPIVVTVAGSYDRRADAWNFRTVPNDYEPTEFEVVGTVTIEV